MGGGILSKLLQKADDKIYSGLQRASMNHPNSIVGMSLPLFKRRVKQRMENVNDVFANQDLSALLGKDNIKINNTGGMGGPSLLQQAYEVLTKRNRG